MGLNQCKAGAVFILFNIFPYLSASEGDRSPFYQKCVKNCVKINCTDGGLYVPKGAQEIETTGPVIIWNCPDDCRYHCMWRTVQGLQERGYPIPKFHGKWPFKRIQGVQEPASVFASILNLFMHIYMVVQLSHAFPIKEVPMVLYWHIFAMVCMNGWIWSIVFHTRDIPFSEFMDYASALSMIMVLFGSAVIRVFHRYRKLVAAVLLACVLFYADYLRYLYSAKVDYDYNMMVNLFFGVAGSVIWVAWACAQLAAGRRYVWRVVAFTLLSGAALSLELLDFPPYMHAWDAHALWHLSTAPLPLVFYRFVIDDMHYILKTQKLGSGDYKSA